MATQRRRVALLVEENGLFRVTRVTVNADSDEEAVRRSVNTARSVLRPGAKVVGACKSKVVGAAMYSDEVVVENPGETRSR